MTKVGKFPESVPARLGLQKARKGKDKNLEKHGQLNLFSGGKVVKLHQLTPFEEALLMDEQDNLHSARLMYEKAIVENDSTADAFCNLGILEFKAGQYAKAIDCFTNCLKHEPRHFEAHYNLANLYSEVGEFSLAKFHSQVAIEIEPEFTNSYFNLGLTHAMCKDYKDAIGVLLRYRALVSQEEHKLVDDLVNALQRNV